MRCHIHGWIKKESLRSHEQAADFFFQERKELFFEPGMLFYVALLRQEGCGRGRTLGPRPLAWRSQVVFQTDLYSAMVSQRRGLVSSGM